MSPLSGWDVVELIMGSSDILNCDKEGSKQLSWVTAHLLPQSLKATYMRSSGGLVLRKEMSRYCNFLTATWKLFSSSQLELLIWIASRLANVATCKTANIGSKTSHLDGNHQAAATFNWWCLNCIHINRLLWVLHIVEIVEMVEMGHVNSVCYGGEIYLFRLHIVSPQNAEWWSCCIFNGIQILICLQNPKKWRANGLWWTIPWS